MRCERPHEAAERPRFRLPQPITVQSYLDRLDFGLICDPELVPDVDLMLDAILADVAALARYAGFTTAGADEPDAVTTRNRQHV